MSATQGTNRTQSLAQLLLRRVLLAYVSFALVITGVQMFLEYRMVRADIVRELDSIAGTFAPGVESALWDMQAPLLGALVQGIGANPVVASVEIRDAQGGTLDTAWRAPSGRQASSDLAVQRLLVHGSGPARQALGTLRIASSEAVLLARVVDTFRSIAVMAAGLFVCLGLLLWLLVRMLVVRPLSRFSEQVAAQSAGGLGSPIDLGRVEVGEIETLRQGFNRLVGQLTASHAKVAEQNMLLENEKAQIRSIIDVIPDLIFIKDRNGVYAGCNKAFEAFAGRSEREVAGLTDAELFGARVAELARRRDLECMRFDSFLSYEVTVADSQGRARTMETLKAALRGPAGEVLGIVGTSRDITERKSLEEQHRLASMVYRNSSEAMVAADEDGRIISINPAFTEMTGYGAVEVLGRRPELLASVEREPDSFARVWQAAEAAGRWKGEIWIRHRDGHEIAVWLTINAIPGEDGKAQRSVLLFSDITEKKKVDNLIWTQANYDALTGLPNRRLFQDRLEQAIRKAARDQTRIAVLFIDLDRFKEVNDSMGHETGDRLLVEAAARIRRRIRDADTLSRFGGDEFTVIQGDLRDASGIGRICTAIIERLSEPFALDGQEVYVSGSIGIALYPDDATTVTDLVRQADQAMYAAKTSGRGRFHFFTRTLQEASESRIRLGGDLRRAIKEDQLTVHYQPVVDLRSGEVQKAEALLRWRHPVHGHIGPATFIPIAEETGTIQELGDWVFSEAIAQTRRWQALRGPSFQVGVNVSPLQFLREARGRMGWIEMLREAGLPGSSIVVEITEGLLMSEESEVYDILLRFRDAGIQVAIDDFGTGYSALSYLKKFHIDYLKIDRSFTNNLAPGSADFALCEAIVVMAHKLDLKVIAEGVETAAQRELLQQIGCDYAQGYLFSRPVPAEEFDRLLERAPRIAPIV